MNCSDSDGAFSASGSLVRSSDIVFQSAGVEQKNLDRGLDALLVELARVDAHGFTPTELERAKKDLLRQYTQQYQERDKEESDRYSSEILNVFPL